MKRKIRLFPDVFLAVTAIGATLAAATPAAAQSHVVSVEEHWELKLSQPDADLSAPQTSMVMSPTADLTGTHFLFTLNHSAVPEYQPGGMQVQLWNGDELLEEHQGDNAAKLQFNGESVHWVQRLSLSDGTLTFQVQNGESESWGTFGGDDLSLSSETSLTALNSYRPSVSLGESQVGYAENRVNSLTLKKLVWVTDDGQTHEMDAPIPIDVTLGD